MKTRVEGKNKVLESVGVKLEELDAIGGSLNQHTGKFTLTLPRILVIICYLTQHTGKFTSILTRILVTLN